MDRLKQVSQVPPRELVVNAAAITTVLSAVVWGVRDYQAFLALGPGGVAHNVKGWLLVTLLRPFALSKRGALRASDYPSVGAHEEIEALPNRTGPRATVGGIVPHRQLSQHPGEGMKPVPARSSKPSSILVATNPLVSISQTSSRMSSKKIANFSKSASLCTKCTILLCSFARASSRAKTDEYLKLPVSLVERLDMSILM